METAEIYTVEQVAEKMTVGSATVREWLRTKRLHGHKVGRLWRITSDDIHELLESTKQ